MNDEQTRPTAAELDILRTLWKFGPCSVKEVQAHLESRPPRGYTTVLKLLQIMTRKGLVTRHKKDRAHIYKASQSAEQTQKNILSTVLNKVFDGSSHKLVMQALATRTASRDELEEIRRLLDNLEGEAK